MTNGPETQWVTCQDCGAETVAVIPAASNVVDDADRSDGKVWVNCWDCGERFLVHYRTGTEKR